MTQRGLIDELLDGGREVVWFVPGQGVRLEPTDPPVGLLAGSFNPLHRGHCRLRQAAEQRLAGPVVYELSVVNAEKPPLTRSELMRRVGQPWDAPVAVTRAATFLEKARLFPRMVFVVGADTAARIVDRRFYDDSQASMHSALEEIAEAECRFLVAARKVGRRLLTLADLPIEARWRRLFDELPVEAFRCDVSSTQLRQSGRGASPSSA